MENMNVINLENARKNRDSDVEIMISRFEEMLEMQTKNIYDMQEKTMKVVREIGRNVEDEMRVERVEREKMYNGVMEVQKNISEMLNKM